MVERVSYRGWKNSWRISNGTVEVIVLADVGPRILRYAFCGDTENIFHEVEADAGRTGGSDFRLYGGHRLWAWPEIARTYFPDSRPIRVLPSETSIRFVAPTEDLSPGEGLQKEMEVCLEAGGTTVRVEHTIANRRTGFVEIAVWCPTMMRAGGRAILPLPARVAMDSEHYQSVGPLTLWSCTDLADPRWRFGTDFIQLKQEKPRERFPEQMTGIFNPAGWGAYYSAGTVFIKRTDLVAGARYPDFGCNIEIFTNGDFLELESLSPITTLKPGECARHTETWTLFRGVPAGEDDDWIRSAIVPLAEVSRT